MLDLSKEFSLSGFLEETEEDGTALYVMDFPDDVYITVDVDAMDPAYLPATGTPEPEGIRYRDILDTIKAVAQTKHIIGFDVVELAPSEEFKASDFIVAKLIYQILSYKYFYQH